MYPVGIHGIPIQRETFSPKLHSDLHACTTHTCSTRFTGPRPNAQDWLEIESLHLEIRRLHVLPHDATADRHTVAI